MKPRTAFGESALAKSAKEEDRVRKADVVAEPGCAMLKLAVEDFRSLVGHSLDLIASKNLNLKLLQSVKFKDTTIASLLPTSELEKLADACEEITFRHGEDVIKEGAAADSFYVIKAGEVRARAYACCACGVGVWGCRWGYGAGEVWVGHLTRRSRSPEPVPIPAARRTHTGRGLDTSEGLHRDPGRRRLLR